MGGKYVTPGEFGVMGNVAGWLLNTGNLGKLGDMQRRFAPLLFAAALLVAGGVAGVVLALGEGVSPTVPASETGKKGCVVGSEQVNPVTGRKQVCK